MTLKDLLKKNKITFFIGIQVLKIHYLIIYYIVFNIKKIGRVTKIYKNSPYEKLKKIKNKHSGERCFIVATGPSLTIEDLEKLKNEVTFSMNSICLAFDETDWRPTYYGIQDIKVFNSLKDDIEKLVVEGKFISDNLAKKMNVLDDHYVFPLNLLNHVMKHRKYHSKFSEDAFAVVYSGYSITYSLIQIAVYMGFEEIYLLGADCNYSSDMNHHFKEYGYVDPSFSLAHDQMVAAYKVAKQYTDRNNVKIFNATRGGMLEVFERVNLDAVITGDTENYIYESV
ncbi:6-hydroxymethylpterin diphosphokinase MptE-like protein [Cytobacillus massiliigabonensis]|uniref:6-hydroxymethylpterin diphosphokinase MptE-like protein n=1 Tax=Cytobacillus massiliigabonensis TaxID=1871011 RepID=UPI000C84050F|nr:6-hydroxymethylpterin diphosphokinase MptE-like protein [Cytobacillus massiliigabonensis]